jgi:hypothetical protein
MGRIADCCFFLLRQSSVKNVFIRGSVVRYVHLPANAVDTPLLEDATRRGTNAIPGKRVVACLLTAKPQRLHRLLPRPSRTPHDLPKCVLCLARCQCCPRDEPLYDETRMTRLAAPPGCTFGTSIGESQSVERQRRYALSANQERVLTMFIPSSGFLELSCLVHLHPHSLHGNAKVPRSSDNELKEVLPPMAVQSVRQFLTCKGRGVICKAPLSLGG